MYNMWFNIHFRYYANEHVIFSYPSEKNSKRASGTGYFSLQDTEHSQLSSILLTSSLRISTKSSLVTAFLIAYLQNGVFLFTALAQPFLE